MMRFILFIKKKYLSLLYGSQFKSIGNTKIGKNFSVIYGDDKCEVLIGSNVTIGNNVVLHCDGLKLKIGDNSIIDHNNVLRLWGGEIIIGSNVYINSGCVLDGHGSLKIGDNCLIGMQVAIIPSDHIYENINVDINKQGEHIRPISIEDNVWIGSGAKILAGVCIKKGSIIGSNAVVKSNIEGNVIAAGIPAIKIKNR